MGVEVVTGSRVDYALGLAGAAAGVEDEQQVFAVHRFRRAVGGDAFLQVVPPVVAPGFHLDLLAGALNHQDIFHRGHAFRQGFVHLLFQGDDRIFAPASVSGDHEFGLPVDQAISQGFGAKSAKNDTVRCTDAGAGEHGDCSFWNHGHVDADAIAFSHAQLFEDVGKLADFPVQLGVGEGAGVARFALPNQGGFVFAPGSEVPVETVVGNVGFTADKPLGKGGLPVEYGVPLLEPVQFLFGELRPEFLGVGFGAFVQLSVVFQTFDVGVLGEFRWRLQQPLFLQDGFDGGFGHRCFCNWDYSFTLFLSQMGGQES